MTRIPGSNRLPWIAALILPTTDRGPDSPNRRPTSAAPIGPPSVLPGSGVKPPRAAGPKSDAKQRETSRPPTGRLCAYMSETKTEPPAQSTKIRIDSVQASAWRLVYRPKMAVAMTSLAQPLRPSVGHTVFDRDEIRHNLAPHYPALRTAPSSRFVTESALPTKSSLRCLAAFVGGGATNTSSRRLRAGRTARCGSWRGTFSARTDAD